MEYSIKPKRLGRKENNPLPSKEDNWIIRVTMKKYLDTFKEFLSSRLYCSILLLLGVCTYGFVITHYAIGIDDTAISLYFDEGLAPYVGRWTLYIINKVIPLTEMSPFFMELISMIIMLFSATTWCILLKKICNGCVELPIWMYAIFAGIFISCPLISEVYVYYLHNGLCLAYGLTALSLLAFLEALHSDTKTWKMIGTVVLSVILLTIAIGCYESMLLVYIMAAIMIFVFQRITKAKNGCEQKSIGIIRWIIIGAIILSVSLIIRSGIINLLNYVNDFETAFAELDSAQRISIFGSMTRDEIVMNIKYYFIKYFINAISYFPIRMLLCSYAVLGCIAVVFSVMKRDFWILICTILLPILPAVMCFVGGDAITYRAAQYVPVVITFAVFFAAVLIWRIRWKAYLFRSIYAVLLSTLIWTQSVEMNQWFMVDYMRYEYEKEILLQVAKDLQATCDVTKPIVFCGSVETPVAITETSELAFSDSRFPYSRLMFDKFLPGMTGKQYCPQGYGYHFRETIFNNTISWGIAAFDGTGTQVIQYLKMLGYNFYGEKDLEKISEARAYVLEVGMPEYPVTGYIQEFENYIIVNF